MSTTCSQRQLQRRSVRQRTSVSGPLERRHSQHRRADPTRQPRRHQPLARYEDARGCQREVLTKSGAAGSVLIVDRDASTRGDLRLVAHLAADEPAQNAALICRLYIEDIRAHHWRCRRVTAEDAQVVPFTEEQELELAATSPIADPEPVDQCGGRYRLEPITTDMSIPELRWRRLSSHPDTGNCHQVVSLRQAVGCLESYEPLRSVTLRELALRRRDAAISTTALTAELARVQNSPIVLNRGLREAALRSIEREQLSMSEIAIRCGRVKRDSRGNESGETSWLGRRLGLLPEAGQETPTPWIHSDVLALICRRGLGVSPREVELG